MKQFSSLQYLVDELRPCSDVLCGLEDVAKLSESPNELYTNLYMNRDFPEFKTEAQEEFLNEFLSEGDCLTSWRHPLYIETHFSITGATALRLGFVVDQKCDFLEQCIKDGDLVSFIFAYSRPFRLDGLLGVIRELDSDLISDIYWDLVSSVWVDSEEPCRFEENVHVWQHLWGNSAFIAEHMVNHLPAEKGDFDKLPSTIKIYRAGELSGLSWTTSKKTATFFKNRCSEDCKLWSAMIDKSDVKWFTNGRGESEIVVTDIGTLKNVSETIFD